MNAEQATLPPKERLAISRRALMEHLGGDDDEDRPRVAADAAATEFTAPRRRRSRNFLDSTAWGFTLSRIAERWWRRHPANAVGQIARPLLDRYARKEPVKLVAAAAATGAVMVLVKPWRLLSVTAVLAALLKTSDVADLVTTLMKNTNPRKDLP